MRMTICHYRNRSNRDTNKCSTDSYGRKKKGKRKRPTRDIPMCSFIENSSLNRKPHFIAANRMNGQNSKTSNDGVII